MEEQVKKCPNCFEWHTGMFDVCYHCHDCDSELEYENRNLESRYKSYVLDAKQSDVPEHQQLSYNQFITGLNVDACE